MNRPADVYCYCPERYNKTIDKKVMAAMKDVFIETIIENDDGLLLPHRWGALYIRGTTNKVTDRSKAKKYKKKVLYQNYHTHGISYYVHSDFFQRRYKTVKKSFPMSRYLLFYPYKKIKRAIFNSIKEEKFEHWKTNL